MEKHNFKFKAKTSGGDSDFEGFFTLANMSYSANVEMLLTSLMDQTEQIESVTIEITRSDED